MRKRVLSKNHLTIHSKAQNNLVNKRIIFVKYLFLIILLSIIYIKNNPLPQCYIFVIGRYILVKIKGVTLAQLGL